MVGEDQVLATAVNVQSCAQVGHGHGGALYVPARPAGSPGAFPRWLTHAGALPQHKVHGVFFALVHFYSGAGLHAVQGPVAQFAVIVFLGDAEEYVAPAGVG